MLAPYNSFCQIYAVYTIAYTIAKRLKSAHGSRISWFPQEEGSSIGDSSSLIQLDVWRNCPTIWVILRLKSFLCSWYNVRFWKSGFPTQSPSKTGLCMFVKETTFHLIQTPLKFWFSLGFIFLGPIWGNSMLGYIVLNYTYRIIQNHTSIYLLFVAEPLQSFHSSQGTRGTPHSEVQTRCHKERCLCK